MNEEIEILGLFFSNVGVRMPETKFDWWSTREVVLDERIRSVFKGYIEQISSPANTISRYSAGIDDTSDEGAQIEETLSLLARVRLPAQYDQFEEKSLFLTKRLCGLIDKRMRVPVIFVCQFMFHGGKHVCVLNLSLLEREQFRVDKTKKTIEYSAFGNILPSPDELQKGAVSPYPTDTSIPLRVFQKGQPADFFNLFLMAKPVLGTRDGMKHVYSTITGLFGRSASLDEMYVLCSSVHAFASQGNVLMGKKAMAKLLHGVYPSLPEAVVETALSENGYENMSLSAQETSEIAIIVEMDSANLTGKVAAMQGDVTHHKAGGRSVVTVTSAGFNIKVRA